MNITDMFVLSVPDTSLLYVAIYSSKWIAISILIAIFASYAALKASSRVESLEDFSSKLTWVIIASLTMGVGTWAMHFIGMLALRLPCGIAYDPFVTLASMIPGILAAGAAFGIAWHHRIIRPSPLIGSLLLGSGIGTMHYTGMAAMRLEGVVRYDPVWFALSILVAVVLSYIALRAKKRATFSRKDNLLTAVILGGAVSGMHYTAMAASYFVKGDAGALPPSVFTPDSLAIIVALATVLMAFTSLALASLSHAREMTNKYRLSEQRFRSMIEAIPDLVWLKDLQGVYLACNREFERFLGAHETNIVGKTDSDSVDAGLADFFRQNDRNAIEANQLCINETWITYAADAQRILLETREVAVRNSEGEIMGILGVGRDITERKQSEEKMQLSARVFAEAHEGITITDARGTIIDVNPTFCEITGYSREEAIGQNSRFLSSGRHSHEFYKEMWNTLTVEGHWKGEVWNRRKSGELYAQLLTISAMRDNNETVRYYVGLFSDITHTKSQQQALEQMAHYDPLTQLPNRVLFADRFQQAIARARRDETLLGVCYLDLDGFKQINDTLGHEVGDRLLVEAAERIKSCLREEDTVSRMGGDEFAMLICDIHTLDEFEQVLRRVHGAIARTFMIDDQPVNIAASCGVALYPLDDADPDTLLRHADQAMYQAKSEGRNRYCLFDASHDLELQVQRQQLCEIEEAFSRQELCLYYQPKVNMITGEVLGAEALIRWNHPERGLVPPMEFLPLIEGTAFDIVVGNWVIDQALRQADVWNQQGLVLEISVNISPYHLQWPQFVTQLEATLSLYPQIPSHQLQLEVLESSMVTNLSYMSETLRACRDALGVSIALDDFGTGYSSLTYLRHLPANTIKIDQSFVRNMIDDPNDYAIVDGVVGLAEAFRREVIAEGVETRDHGLMLLIMGCLFAQGYGIARPMPADSIAEWIRTYRPDAKWKSYGQEPLSPKEAQLLLLIIESSQWIRRIEAAVQSPPSSQPDWPIMDFDKCHCGRWLLQARKEQQFDQVLLARLAIAHEELHQQGTQLYRLHQAGNIEEARAGVDALHNTGQLIEGILSTMS